MDEKARSKSILEELFDGNVQPAERMVPKNPQYRSINRQLSDTLERCKEGLPEETCRQLESLLDLRDQSNAMEVSESFACGFKLGALLMMEVLAAKGEFVGAGKHAP